MNADGRLSSTQFAAVGFWLPCDQAHFFDHEGNRDYRNITELTTPALRAELGRLEDPVYHRLMITLAKQDFTHAIPVYHSERPFGQDPDAGVFVHPTFSGPSFTILDEHDQHIPVMLPTFVEMSGLALLVNSSGFYLLLARYQSSEQPVKATDAVHAYLRRYVYALVGGNFASRYSGWPDDRNLVTDEYERKHTLRMYAQDCLGILTFEQVNIIFEGLFSSALDFEVFFYDNGPERHHAVRAAKRKYSLGGFAELIVTDVLQRDYKGTSPSDPGAGDDWQMADNTHSTEVKAFLHSLNTAHPHRHAMPAEPRSIHLEAYDLCHYFLGERGCGVLLRKFLQATSANTLLKYKQRVERCRRALVMQILEVTQRQDPLLQAEVPDVSSDRIVGVNEAQLRGYVLFFSAKLPLIHNVQLYLSEISTANAWFLGRTRKSAEPNNEAARETEAALALWRTLYRALENDLHGLEHAIEQERMDTMVREEEKVRIEQETLAEIERLQDRTSKSLSPRTTLTISVLANVFALTSVVVAIVSLIKSVGLAAAPRTPRGPITYRDIFPQFSPLTILAFFGTVLVLALLYWLTHAVGTVVLSGLSRLLRLVHIHWGDRYYYEMDLHLEAPLAADAANELLSGRFPFDGPARAPIPAGTRSEGEDKRPRLVRWSERGGQFWAYVRAAVSLKALGKRFRRVAYGSPFRDIERNSYRVERMSPNEAAHKVYIEGTFRLKRPRWYWIRAPRIPLILVYEILFHRPSQTHRFILQDLRVVSTNSRVLTSEQLDYVKRTVAEHCVNVFIPADGQWRIQTNQTTDQPVDATMSLTSPGLPARRSLAQQYWRQFSEHLTEMLELGGLLFVCIYGVRIIIMLIERGATYGISAVFDGTALPHTLALDEAWNLWTQNPWLAALPLLAIIVLSAATTPIAQANARRQIRERMSLSQPQPSEVPSTDTASTPDQQIPNQGMNSSHSQTSTSPTVGGLIGMVLFSVLMLMRMIGKMVVGTLGVLLSIPTIADVIRWIATQLL